jgi:Spy/CpxP family protein refolding chaperone
MKKRTFFYSIIIITLINISALATIIYQHLKSETISKVNGRATRFEQVKKDLSLTPTQINRFKEIRKIFHTGLDSLDSNMEKIREELLQEIWKMQTNEIQIDSLLHKISRTQMESQRLVIWHFYQFKEVLNREQWQKFYTFVSIRFPSHERFKDSRNL